MSRVISFAAKLPQDTITEIRKYCKEKGIKIGVFISHAIKEKIEREELLEDSADMMKLRFEESAATPLEDYFAKRGV
ncbi:MAG: hypothetical protein AB1349_00235 [Elusimicrobiota bacterium]